MGDVGLLQDGQGSQHLMQQVPNHLLSLGLLPEGPPPGTGLHDWHPLHTRTYMHGQQGVELGDIQGYTGAKQGVAWQASENKKEVCEAFILSGGQHVRG